MAQGLCRGRNGAAAIFRSERLFDAAAEVRDDRFG